MNEKQTNLDLMQIKVHPNLLEFPEITGNKHKFLIRFFRRKKHPGKAAASYEID